MVVIAASWRGWLDDHRRLRWLSEFRAPERNSSRHQKRDARSRDGVRSAGEIRLVGHNARQVSEKRRNQLDTGRAMAGTQLPSGIQERHGRGDVQYRPA